MLSAILLEAHNYGGLVGLFEGLLVAVVLIGLLLWAWSRRIEQQFDRTQDDAREGETQVTWRDRLLAGFFVALGLLGLWLSAIY